MKIAHHLAFGMVGHAVDRASEARPALHIVVVIEGKERKKLLLSRGFEYANVTNRSPAETTGNSMRWKNGSRIEFWNFDQVLRQGVLQGRTTEILFDPELLLNQPGVATSFSLMHDVIGMAIRHAQDASELSIRDLRRTLQALQTSAKLDAPPESDADEDDDPPAPKPPAKPKQTQAQRKAARKRAAEKAGGVRDAARKEKEAKAAGASDGE